MKDFRAMTSKIYSQYDNLAEYTRTVGMFCSLLYRNGFVTSEQLDDILSSSCIFESIELGHNPLLATSSEKTWISLLLRDSKFCSLFKETAREKLSDPEKHNLEFDWLSMWAGDIIASIAVHYDIRMRDVVEMLSFEDFLGFSVANHGQPNERMYSVFSERSNGKYPPPSDAMLQLMNADMSVANASDSQLLVECLGVAELAESIDDGRYLVGAVGGYNTSGLLAALGAVRFFEDGKVLQAVELADALDNIPTSLLAADAETSTCGIVQIPNSFGAWNKRKMLLESDEERDRTRYLKYMMPMLVLVGESWVAEHASSMEEITCPAYEMSAAASSMSDAASSYMRVPLR